jgi:hypothetical protein
MVERLEEFGKRAKLVAGGTRPSDSLFSSE